MHLSCSLALAIAFCRDNLSLALVSNRIQHVTMQCFYCCYSLHHTRYLPYFSWLIFLFGEAFLQDIYRRHPFPRILFWQEECYCRNQRLCVFLPLFFYNVHCMFRQDRWELQWGCCLFLYFVLFSIHFCLLLLQLLCRKISLWNPFLHYPASLYR